MKPLAMFGVLMVLVLLAGLAWLGAFKSVETGSGPQGPWHLAFQEGHGPYKGAAKVIEEVRAEVEKAGARAHKGFGIYFDDPKQVPQESLRWEAGVLVDAESSSILARARGHYTLKVLARSEAVHASFPMKSMLSIFVGISKAYPALDRKRLELGWAAGPIMETYGDGKIEYYLFKPGKI